ncbi:hypothetical protein ABT095_10570 [Kitasatospora sp. NPDC002227]|uniref:hypothetical protein n=1 Tax=Kitasatospora sp. NPDC002227 TaxID=3154773 RepID=UPI00331D5DF6
MPVSDDQPHTRTRLPVAEQSVYQPSARRSRPLRTLLAVLVVVTLLVLAISIVNRNKPAPSAAPPSADRATPAPAGTAASGQEPVTTTSHGIGSGYPHSDQGAQSAAANYAAALGSAEMFQPATRHTIVATVADPSVADGLQGRLDQAYTAQTFASFGLDAQGKAPKGLTFVSRTVPVGTKTTNSADTATKVGVWCTRLTGLAGEHSTQPVSATWYTLDLTMRWTGSDWKVTDFTQTPGPAPVPGDQQAATADEITRAVQDFGGFRYAR